MSTSSTDKLMCGISNLAALGPCSFPGKSTYSYSVLVQYLQGGAEPAQVGQLGVPGDAGPRVHVMSHLAPQVSHGRGCLHCSMLQ